MSGIDRVFLEESPGECNAAVRRRDIFGMACRDEMIMLLNCASDD